MTKIFFFKVKFNEGYECKGYVSMEAQTEEEAYEKTMVYICDNLSHILPELDIEVGIECITSKWIWNDNEKILIALIEEAKQYCEGELELFHDEDGWYARDYKPWLNESFVINKNDYDVQPLITDETIQNYKVDVDACCIRCNVYVCG